MSVKLSSGVMPPSNVGRKPKPVNAELLEALFQALQENKPEVVETENFESKLYPPFFGPDFTEKVHAFEKEHQASAEGRKYADPLKKRIGKKVVVNVYHNGKVDSEGKPTAQTRYTWRLYIPVSEYSEAEQDEFAGVDSEAETDPEEVTNPESVETNPEYEPNEDELSDEDLDEIMQNA